MDSTLIKGLLYSASHLLPSGKSRSPRVGAGDQSSPGDDLSDVPSCSPTTHVLPRPCLPLPPPSSEAPLADAAPGHPPPPGAAPHTTTARETHWIRPLGYCEKLMTSAHVYGIMNTCYALWLDVRKPLDFDLVKRATKIMYRKMPHVQLGVGRHLGALWWRKMASPALDVDELTTDDVMAAFEELLRHRYSLEGPLWFLRLVTPEGKSVLDETAGHSHKYVCIFGFHHSVSDGTTNMQFCKVFVQVLDDLLQGRDVDMCSEGRFAEPFHDILADAATSHLSLLSLFLSRFYKGILSYGAYVRNFTRLFPMPTHKVAETHILHYELEETTSKKLYLRCKMEGVTLNSAFTAAANLALYLLMSARGHSLKATQINCVQVVNMRRYWPKPLQPNTFGCNISILDLDFQTEEKNLEEFWEYSRLVHSNISHHLTVTQRALTVQPISERLKLVIGSNFWLSRLGLPSTNNHHYCLTNMGNLRTAFPGTGDEVQVSKVLRSVSCHFMPTLCQHTLQTFRGRLCYSLDYYTQKMTRETASQYAEEILRVLTSSIHAPN
nr:uncharacterized protein LOC123768665 [Procambarus clarkii]XP_045615409.1 uncharacterized protein LOC123768665 [Procambarus clarkii]